MNWGGEPPRHSKEGDIFDGEEKRLGHGLKYGELIKV